MGLNVQTKINSITLPSDKARKPLYANQLAEGDAKYLAAQNMSTPFLETHKRNFY